MELLIKEANNSYTKVTAEKQNAQEELSVCEEVTKSLNREKKMIEEDLRILKMKYEKMKEMLSELLDKECEKDD